MSKIIEKIIEPFRIEIGSIFLLKIKVIRHATYEELQNKTYQYVKDTFTYENLKGD